MCPVWEKKSKDTAQRAGYFEKPLGQCCKSFLESRKICFETLQLQARNLRTALAPFSSWQKAGKGRDSAVPHLSAPYTQVCVHAKLWQDEGSDRGICCGEPHPARKVLVIKDYEQSDRKQGQCSREALGSWET